MPSKAEPVLYRAYPQRCAVEWRWARPHIVKALVDGDMTVKEIRGEVYSGGMQLWLIDYGQLGAVVTQRVTGERGEVCLIVACGGKKMEAWLHLIEEIEDWARQSGCIEMRLIGRLGWKRTLAGRDYHQTGVVLARKL